MSGSQRGVTRDDAPPALYNVPRGDGAAGARDPAGDPTLEDDEAVAKALQDEYDREHSDLRQANRHQQQPDYRSAGYADPHASTMPSTVPVGFVVCAQPTLVLGRRRVPAWCRPSVRLTAPLSPHRGNRRRAPCAKE